MPSDWSNMASEALDEAEAALSGIASAAESAVVGVSTLLTSDGLDHYPADLRPYLPPVLGARYSWGKGKSPHLRTDAVTGVMFDCSGLVETLEYLLGICLPRGQNSAAMADDCEPVPIGQQRATDLAFYASGGGVCHVVMCVTGPLESEGGHSLIWGANSGGSSTHGDDPNACVKEAPADYWASAFATYGRRKPRATDAPWRAFIAALERSLVNGDPTFAVGGRELDVSSLAAMWRTARGGGNNPGWWGDSK